MRESGVLLNGTASCEVLILTLKADLIFCLYSYQLLFALTDTSTFLEKKTQVEPFTCQSKLERSTRSTPSFPQGTACFRNLTSSWVAGLRLSCATCVDVG